MTMALRAQNKLRFSVKKPAGSSLDFRKWQRCNGLVSSWILHSFTKELAYNIL